MSTNARNELQFRRVLAHLDHDDPTIRRRAIEWLAKHKNPAAVKSLTWVAKTDPDQEVRTLAHRAAAYITNQTQTVPAVTDTPRQTQVIRKLDPNKVQRQQSETKPLKKLDRSKIQRQQSETKPLQSSHATKPFILDDTELELESVDVTPPPVASKPEPKRQTGYFESVQDIVASVVEDYEVYDYENPDAGISRQDWEMARTLVGNAYTDHVHNRPIAGLKKLGRALDLDPKVQHEEATQKAVLALTDNLSYEQALAMLFDAKQRAAYITRREKQQVGLSMFSTPWDVVLQTLIFAVIQIVGLAGLLNIWAWRSGQLMSMLDANRDYSAFVRLNGVDPAASYRPMANMLMTHDAVSLTYLALRVGGLAVVALFAVHTLAHLVSRYGMNGTAHYTESMTNLFTLPSVMTAMVYGLGIILLYVVYPQSFVAVQQVWPLWILRGALVLLAVPALITVWMQSEKIGHLHDIGMVAGLTIFVLCGLILSFIGYGAYAYFPYFRL